MSFKKYIYIYIYKRKSNTYALEVPSSDVHFRNYGAGSNRHRPVPTPNYCDPPPPPPTYIMETKCQPY